MHTIRLGGETGREFPFNILEYKSALLKKKKNQENSFECKAQSRVKEPKV